MSNDKVKLEDPLASVIYDLISLHVPPGVLEEVIDRVEIMEEGKEIEVEFHLGHIAMDLAERLRELDIYHDNQGRPDEDAKNKERLS